MKVKVTTVGSSTGIVLPKEALARLRVQKGDTLYITETPSGIQLSPYDEDLARQIEAGREVMRENRDVLRKLAK
ncbi:MAG TPA: AbrB/MazE/SpoVT family DNA-binding domain-containing protein [Terriglobales bacterium]|nr:AbrB/MazE/SpoVT family DNA-binding domain-containing protein [Terriglobales bacterium]